MFWHCNMCFCQSLREPTITRRSNKHQLHTCLNLDCCHMLIKPHTCSQHLLHSHTFLHSLGQKSPQIQCHPGWRACTAAVSITWICSVLACPPWSPVSLSAKPSGLYQTSQRGLSINCAVGSSEVMDSFGFLRLSFRTLQMHQGVLTFSSFIVSSRKRPLSFSVAPALPLPSLFLARRQSMRVTGL